MDLRNVPIKYAKERREAKSAEACLGKLNAARCPGQKEVSTLIGTNRFNQLLPRDLRHEGVPCEIVIKVHFLAWV